jgi:hypothetical protein
MKKKLGKLKKKVILKKKFKKKKKKKLAKKKIRVKITMNYYRNPQ